MQKIEFNNESYFKRVDDTFDKIVSELTSNANNGIRLLDVVVDRDLYNPVSNRIRKEIPNVGFVVKHKSGMSVVLKNNKVGFTLKFKID